jgi:hypothetical protein
MIPVHEFDLKMDITKGITRSDKAGLQAATEELSEGQVTSFQSPKPSLLHRFNEWIKLDASEINSVHGRWSNVGMENARLFFARTKAFPDLDPVALEKQTWRSHHCK